MKKIILISISVMFLLVLAMPVLASYTKTTDTTCNGAVCTTNFYSGLTYIYEDDKWKPIQEAKSLKQYYTIDYISQEKGLDFEIVSLNFTDIEFILKSVNPDLIPISVFKYELTKDTIEPIAKEKLSEQFDFSKEKEEKGIISKNVKYTFEEGVLGYHYKLGSASTEIILQDNATENLADAPVANADPGANQGSVNSLSIKNVLVNERIKRSYIMFNISQVPPAQTIIKSEFFWYADDAIAGITPAIYLVNTTWEETVITYNNQPCGTAFNNADNCNLTAINNTANAVDGWDAFLVTSAVKREYLAGKSNISFAIKDLTEELDGGGDYTPLSKENANTSGRPYLSITYGSLPSDQTTGLLNITYNSTINHIKNIVDITNLIIPKYSTIHNFTGTFTGNITNFTVDTSNDGSIDFNLSVLVYHNSADLNFSSVQNCVDTCSNQNGSDCICQVEFNGGTSNTTNHSLNLSYYPYSKSYAKPNVSGSTLSNYGLMIPRLPNSTDLVGSNTSAVLILDGNLKEPTKTIYDDALMFNVTTYTPSYTTNSTHYWLFNKSYVNTTKEQFITFINIQEIIAPSILGVCGDGVTNTSLLNISFLDEELLTALSSNLDISFEGYYELGTFLTLNNSYNFTNIQNVGFCSDKDADNRYLIAMTYSSSGYPIKLYNFLGTLTTANTTNMSLYLDNNANVTNILVTLYDPGSRRLSDYFIKFERYYPSLNKYYNVETIKSDNNGEANFHLIPLLVEYRILVYNYDGDLIKLIPRTTIKSTTVSITIPTEETTMPDYENLKGAVVSLTFDNNTKEIIWQSQQANSFPLSCLQVVRLSSGGQVLYDNCQSGKNVVDSYIITESTKEQIYQFKGYFKNDNGEIISSTMLEYNTFRTVRQIYGKMGLFLTLIITVTMFMIGIHNPAVAIALSGLGIVVSMWIGFITLTISSLVIFILMIGFLIYKMKT